MFYLYILYSLGSDKYYVGHTHDPITRLAQHNNQPDNTYTSKHRPWEMQCYFPVSKFRGEALKLERYIKKQKSRHLLESIIEERLKEKRPANFVKGPGSSVG